MGKIRFGVIGAGPRLRANFISAGFGGNRCGLAVRSAGAAGYPGYDSMRNGGVPCDIPPLNRSLSGILKTVRESDDMPVRFFQNKNVGR